jgi:hypothetical protein
VRDAESINRDITNIKSRAGRKNSALKLRFQLKFNRFASEAIAINRYVKFLGKANQPGNMVRMFVCDEDSRQTFRRAANGGKPLAGLAGAEPGINQYAGFASFQIGAIAVGTAAENGELDGHIITLPMGANCGNYFLDKRLRKPLSTPMKG